MFTYSNPDFRVKQSVTFVTSLLLQCAVLAAICAIPVAKMSGPSLRSQITHSTPVTPIYFRPEPAAPPAAAEPAPTVAEAKPAPVPPPAPKPDAAPDTTTEAKATDANASDDSAGDEPGLAPFPGWRMNSMSSASGFAGMHHQIKEALPVFTPEPEILHGKVPESARGKEVVMEVVIDEGGLIVTAQILQGQEVGYDLAKSIVDTLRRWIYIPAKINGVAVASRQKLHFHFPS